MDRDPLDVQRFESKLFQIRWAKIVWSYFHLVRLLCVQFSLVDVWVISLGYGYVDILKDPARSDGDHTVGRFDEVVAFAAAMLTSKMVGETKS